MNKIDVEIKGSKASLYFPEEVLNEIRREARRLDRSFSWLVLRAWRVARPHIRALPSDPGASTSP